MFQFFQSPSVSVWSRMGQFNGFSQNLLSPLLSIACKYICFRFNNKTYLETDGVSMGSQLGPTSASIFLAHHELNWLQDCSNQSKASSSEVTVPDTISAFSASLINFKNFESIGDELVKAPI